MSPQAAGGDLVIRGGTVVDGTGIPRRRADVVIRNGRVQTVGRADRATIDECDTVDADGLIVAPGVVDAHTHYDPQVTYDPLASMSIYHGVTTVLAGNCGFAVAPTRTADQAFVRRLFAKVEQMEPAAMDAVEFNFETFPEYLATRKGRLGINLACYIGHSNVRRWVMGAAGSEREATAAEVEEMAQVVRVAMAAGAAGLSSSHAPTHVDGDGRPVPSRLSGRAELLALAEAAGSVGAGSITYLPASAVGGIDETDENYCIELGERSGLPIIIQGLGGRNKTDAPTATWGRAQEFLNRAVANGTPIYNILITRPPTGRSRSGPRTSCTCRCHRGWRCWRCLTTSAWRPCAIRSGGPPCEGRWRTTTATPSWAPPPRRPCGRPCWCSTCATPNIATCSVARWPTSPPSRAWHRPTPCWTSPSPRICRPGSDG
ncbi:MAG: amidohydrolase family protein, partial [Microthrixaceae bacterium]|nr:amidohydrolase family protein [Microthrixaceae bacterium]